MYFIDSNLKFIGVCWNRAFEWVDNELYEEVEGGIHLASTGDDDDEAYESMKRIKNWKGWRRRKKGGD